MMGYGASRLGRSPIGAQTPMAVGTNGVSATASISGGVSLGDGTAPTAITILAAIGGLVIFYWATRSIQGSR